MKFAQALIIAAAFWHAHGYTIPCHPVEIQKTTVDMPVVDGEPAAMATLGCDIWTSPLARAQAKDPDTESVYCADVVHEVGHVIGLPHSDGWVMESPLYPGDYPDLCWKRPHGFWRKEH